MYFENHYYGKKDILEIREITEIIASGKPKITWDDICDVLIDMWEKENKSEDDEDESDGCDLDESDVYKV